MKRYFVVATLLLVAWACESDEQTTTVGPTATQAATVGTGGAGGSGGSAGGADCPADNPNTTMCSNIDRTCQYGSSCCICSNITCAIVWECVDPSQNDQACPAAAPPAGTACDPNVPACSYCVGEVPRLMVCQRGGAGGGGGAGGAGGATAQWTQGAITGCL